MAPAAVTVLFPKTPDATFDMDYYVGQHMPMVLEKFTPYGCKGWRVARILENAQGGDLPFQVVCTMEFETPDQPKEAFAKEGKDVGNVDKFTNVKPVVMFADVAGQGRT